MKTGTEESIGVGYRVSYGVDSLVCENMRYSALWSSSFSDLHVLGERMRALHLDTRKGGTR